MPITQLHMVNFRSHQDRVFDFGQRSVIIGPNGTGKTNILEALWMLSTTRSFRTHRDHEVIRWGETSAYLQADQWEVGLQYTTNTLQKVLKVNGTIHRPLTYLGNLRAVLFTPDSLNIIQGTPADRRRFLDTILAQRDNNLARLLITYRRIVSQRNALLRLVHLGRANQEDINLWDQQLVSHGLPIIEARRQLLTDLMPEVQRYHSYLADDATQSVTLAHTTSVPIDQTAFLQKLFDLRPREIALQTTLIGPHRDDMLIERNGFPVIDHASRGEMRSLVLALKWAEYQLLKADQYEPLILFDDLFSELDREHRQALDQFLQVGQVVCTTTELENVPKELRKQSLVIPLVSKE